MRAPLCLIAAVVLASAARRATARPPGDLGRFAGVWRGTSICTAAGKPTCHDEVVVHHVRLTTDSGATRLEWTMNKIVAGAEEGMGVLSCHAAEVGGVVCPMRDWRWTFRLRQDTE